ncbi:MAG: NYN domain-containing protein [Planctomycetes bacterium]|nr:NYN domain-containing protein [Planctomycetota bacterium]
MSSEYGKTIAYVDGFNLYYGCLKNTRYKWLNLAKLLQVILPRNDIEVIHYFTARVRGRGHNDQTAQRQHAYLEALSTLPSVKITYGHHLSHIVRLPLANPAPGGPRFAEVVRSEEKGTDVNLATQLVHDAHRNLMECAVIVSNDSDFANAIRICRRELKLPVGVLNPQKRAARTLLKEATFFNKVREGALRISQLPSTLRVGSRQVHRPIGW